MSTEAQSAATSGVFYGAIEAGGTKFICAVADEGGDLVSEIRLPTTDPLSTLDAACDFLRTTSLRIGTLAAIGVASFGPIQLDKRSPRYGCIGLTPKPGWSHTDVLGALRQFSVPLAFDTDVNAAALAEHRWGAGKDVRQLVYVTIGTGIGGGVIVDGAPLHGLMHPEVGHIFPRRHPLDTDFPGVCPFHADCLEGLAAGPAIIARSGGDLQSLSPAHPQWQIEADYLGQLCAQLALTLSPQRIILGGGVMMQARLFPEVRGRFLHWLAGYIDRPQILDDVEHYIVPPALGTRAGILGALALARNAATAASAG